MKSLVRTWHKPARAFACAVSACLILSFLNTAPARGQEKKRCLAGVNYPWVAYGHDFGKNEWGHDGLITGGLTYQTFQDTQGFTDSRLTRTRAHGGTGSLSINADLVGHHPNKTSGEVHFDVTNHRVPGASTPLNLKDKTVRVWVFLPTRPALDYVNEDHCRRKMEEARNQARGQSTTVEIEERVAVETL
jgi:hypothetical protein